MANRKISALSDAAALSGTEQLAAVQSGGNVNITPEQIEDYISSGGLRAKGASTATEGIGVEIDYGVYPNEGRIFAYDRDSSAFKDFHIGNRALLITAAGVMVLPSAPANDDTISEILGRNSVTGAIEYRTASSLVGGSTITDGTWTPTLTNTSNITSSVAFLCTYLRVGNSVTIGGQVRVVPTSTGVVSILHMTIPIASAFATGNECGGTAVAVDISLANQAARISADTATGKITLRYAPLNTNTHNFDFTATYRII